MSGQVTSMESKVFPIYIPSKGRARTATTCALLDQAGIPYTVFVPEVEADQYRLHVAGTIALQQGATIGAVRNELLQRARTEHDGWVWMIDDDITGFYGEQGDGIAALVGASEEIARLASTYALAGMIRRGEGKHKYNVACYNVVALHTTRTLPAWYHGHLRFHEDLDFALQILCAQKRTVRLGTFTFTTPRRGLNPGGLQELYQTSASYDDGQWLCAHYGEKICTPLLTPRETFSVHWGAFRGWRDA